eukprot:m.225786 g.225786  ORF g.225786 m.225786 type:complete len:578 (-) comp16792_c0_seq1:657-2390(-)
MHGQVKVRTSEEVAAAKAKERAEKAKLYVGLREKTIAKRMAGELDDKALVLTETILTNNPDFSTIWNFRREIFLKKFQEITPQEREKICRGELAFVEACIAKNPKSYNSWHQRRWVLLTTPNPDWNAEIALCSKFLQLDERNFHGWDYRRFVVAHMPDAAAAAQAEFEYSMERISKNFSNYSAWHYRSTLLPRIAAQPLTPEVLARELEVVHNAFYIEPKDQSAWFYHRWLLGREDQPPVVAAVHASCQPDDIITLGVAFSKPVALSPTSLAVALPSGPVAVAWQPVGGVGAAALWTTTLPAGIAPATTITVQLVDASFKSEAETCTMTAPAGSETTTARVCTDAATALALWRPAQPQLLDAELAVCQELLEVLDPGAERKWVLLASLHIASALGTAVAHAVCDAALQQLLEVDPIRAGFYRDLHGRIAVNRILTDLLSGPPDAPASLSRLGLARLAAAPLLAGARAVNLSSNILSTLSGVSLLRFVHTIVLDDNRISRLGDLTGLHALRRLSVQNNLIADTTALTGLPSGLTTLFVFGNPIASSGAFVLGETGVEVVVSECDVWALVVSEAKGAQA